MKMLRPCSPLLTGATLVGAIAMTQLSCGFVPTGYGPPDPRSKAAFEIRNLMDCFTEGYYHEHHKMPESLDDLADSGWLLLEPLAFPEMPGLEVIDRPLGSWEEDGDCVRFSYTETGFIFHYYEGGPGKGIAPYIYEYNDDNAAGTYQISGAFGLSGAARKPDIAEIRHSAMLKLCALLVGDYFIEHRSMPSSLSELVNGQWSAREDAVMKLPVIPEGDPGWFYYGVVPDPNIAYYELVDAAGQTSAWLHPYRVRGNVVEFNPRPPRDVDRDEMVSLIDASLSGWGLLALNADSASGEDPESE